MSAVLGAIAFDPTIRGILVVLVGTVVLVGSVYMIIATNSGIRAGLLITLAGLFGWMFLMGTIWWIYGIGLKGRDPAWMPVELNYSREAPVATDVVRKLPPPEDLPKVSDLAAEHPLVIAVAKATEGAKWEPETLTDIVTELTSQATVSADDVTSNLRAGIKKNDAEFLADHPELEPVLAQSDAKLAEEISSEAKAARSKIEHHLGGWCLLSETDTRRGEAVASSDAALVANTAFGEGTATSSYITQDVFLYGGKEPCTPITESSIWSRAWHRVATTFEVKNPKLYSVVTVIKAENQPTIPGEPPPTPKIEPGASTVSVVSLRNLGNRRFIPFCFAVVNGLLFAVVASQLHVRDKRAWAAKAEFEASK
jgi:hypothetical protein